MNTRGKAPFGVLVAISLLVIIGAIFASAQMDDTNQNTKTRWPMGDKSQVRDQNSFYRNNTTSLPPEWGHQSMGWRTPYIHGLTAEQQNDLNTTIATLQQQGATQQEIRAAIQQKLDEFGIFDTQLTNEINQTQQRLTILNREKELRTQGYNWTQINTMIQQEFGQNAYQGYNPDMTGRDSWNGFPCRRNGSMHHQ